MALALAELLGASNAVSLQVRLARFVLGLAALLALVALAAWQGFKLGSDYTANRLEKVNAELRLGQALASAARDAATLSHTRNETERANALAKQLDAEKASHARIAAQLEERLRHENTGRPVTYFSVGWLRQFNAAIGAADLPANLPAPTTAVPASAGAAAAAAQADSGLTPADILGYATGYGQRCQDIASQLNALIDYQEGHHAK